MYMGPSQISFFAYYMEAPSDQLYCLLCGGPLRSVSSYSILGPLQISLFTYYMGPPQARVANSHAYGVILTHLTCYSRTHAIDKFTHAFKINHTHTHAFYKIENNLQFLIIVTFVRLSVTLFIVFLLQNHAL